MKLRGLIDEDLIQYKKASMFLILPFCTFKCDRENGTQVCQNWSVSKLPIIEVSTSHLVERYLNNPISKAVVFGGLEPLDSYDEVIEFITEFRKLSDDEIIIYTGYNYEEITEKIAELSNFKNIIVKFGRFIPGHKKHYDEVLGIELASDNQYAQRIS